MTDLRRSAAPPFKVMGMTWTCWVVETDGGQVYEWRSACGNMTAGRTLSVYWSRLGARVIGKSFPTLRAAMTAAMEASQRKVA